MNRKLQISAFYVALALALWSSASPAQATEPIASFVTSSSSTQAGGHPDFGTSIRLQNPGAPEAARNVIFNGPEGLFGNPEAITQCTSAYFALRECPVSSQAGLITVYGNYEGDPNKLLGTAPIFDMVPGADQTALFAFVVPRLGIPINIPVAVRTGGDYGLRFTVSEITQSVPLSGVDFTLWGFPADSSHNMQRFAKGSPGHPSGCPGEAGTGCITDPTPADITVLPLTDNPTVCTGQPLATSLHVQTYQDPGNLSHADAGYPATTGCEKGTFKPVLYMRTTTQETDAPSGLDIKLFSPQYLSRAVAPSQIRSAIVNLPPGLTINPDAADGQSSCSDAQANFGSEGPANCPDNSKIGTFSLHTVALSGDLPGSIYIGEPVPGDQYRLFLVADGFGVHAKLKASVRPDPQTGQVSVSLLDLPQVPFDDIQLHLFASDRGLMATPPQCRLYPVAAQFFPWNSVLPDQTSTQFFSLDSGPNSTPCSGEKRPFNPRLTAGTSQPTAGAYSDFTLKLDRDDGDQYLGDLNFTMPPGFSGNLRGIGYCPEASISAAARNSGRAEQSAPSCPVTSQVGTSNVAAGPGGHPFHAVGKMFLAGPFKGAPLSLAVVTPALAGPYDYGTIVVRVALNIDPLTAQVRAVSDTVPAIVGGIPIRLRSIQVNIDRPNFTLNPTNCAAMSVDSQGIGDQGAVTDFSSYFHVVNCAALPFRPRMAISQVGPRNATKRNDDPSLRFDLRTKHGEANIKSVSVTLSKAFAIDQRHLGNLCSETELLKTKCAGRQPIGTASAATPLLDAPLTGSTYAVSGSGGLPKLAFVLGGQVPIVPRATSASTKSGALKTTVPTIPDVPIGHFQLTLLGGKKGYLINTRGLCGAPVVSTVEYTAQNGKKSTQKVKLKTPCSKKASKAAARRRHAGD